jgi:hypothetical protein
LKDHDKQRAARGQGLADSAAVAKTLATNSSRKTVTRHLINLLFLPTDYATGENIEPMYASRLRLADLAFALAGYRSDHGRYPHSLKELSPAYIADIPNDPFTDRDLVYQSKGTGYLLYSVGPNGRDDGGRNAMDDMDKWMRETDRSKIPDDDDIAIRTPEEQP